MLTGINPKRIKISGTEISRRKGDTVHNPPVVVAEHPIRAFLGTSNMASLARSATSRRMIKLKKTRAPDKGDPEKWTPNAAKF